MDQTLFDQKEEVTNDRLVEGEECGVRNPVFEVETRPLYYTTTAGNYPKDTRPKCIGHT